MFVSFLIILLSVSVLQAQPYEPTFLLDEISEPDWMLGRYVLASIGDQDDDGYDDILMSVDDGTYLSNHLRIIYGDSTPPYRTLDFAHTNVDTSEVEYRWYQKWNTSCGDYNGDGYTDIMVELCQGEAVNPRMYLFLGGPVLFDTLWDWRASEHQFWKSLGTIGDYDGDGQDDFIQATGWDTYNHIVRYFSGDWPDRDTEPTWTYERSEDHSYVELPMYSGDINGDDWPDFTFGAYRWEEDQIDSVYYDFWFGGLGADSVLDLTIAHDYTSVYTGRWKIIGDVNGDGVDDLMARIAESGITHCDIYYGCDPVDFEVPDAQIDYPVFAFAYNNYVILGDINDDGYDDMGFYDYEYNPPWPQLSGYVFVFLGEDPMLPDPAFGIVEDFEGLTPGYRMEPASDFNGDGIDDWMFCSFDFESMRSRVTIVAGDPRFGMSVPESSPVSAKDFRLGQPYPNPFNSMVTIPLEVMGGHSRLIHVSIYNVLGQEVHSWGDLFVNPGLNEIRWNGQSSKGIATTPGTYYIRAIAGNQISNQKITLLK